MDKNKKIKLPKKCIKMEQEKMMEVYGGKQTPMQNLKNWLYKLGRGSRKK